MRLHASREPAWLQALAHLSALLQTQHHLPPGTSLQLPSATSSQQGSSSMEHADNNPPSMSCVSLAQVCEQLAFVAMTHPGNAAIRYGLASGDLIFQNVLPAYC